MKRLYLIDVSSLFFRAFYAIRHLTNSRGVPTNALYGYLAAITKVLREHNPDGVALCYDRPEPTFREEIYTDYKANRDSPPDDLVLQIPYLKKIGDALNLPSFEIIGFEADDLIGTLARQARERGVDVIIVSGDKDFAQLVGAGVKLFDPSKDTFMDQDGVKAKWGIEPRQVIDYLALVGDSVDNVPGVKGIGPKGAQKLLNEFKTLESLYSRLDEVANERLRVKLHEEKDTAFLSKELVTIRQDVPMEWDEACIRRRGVKQDELRDLLIKELEFKTLAQRLLGAPSEAAAERMAASSPTPAPNASPAPSCPQGIVVGAASAAVEINNVVELSRFFGAHDDIWLDLSAHGLALSNNKDMAVFTGSLTSFGGWLNDFLSKDGRRLFGFDVKSQARDLQLTEKSLDHLAADVLLEAYCLGEDIRLDVDSLGRRFLDRSLPEFARADDRLKLIQNIYQAIQPHMTASTRKIIDDVELPLVSVLWEMESNGVLLDQDQLQTLSDSLAKDIVRSEREIWRLTGVEFNLGSPKQLSQVLFDKLKLPVIRKTKTGLSTDSDVLDKLKDMHPCIGLIIDWRELTKLKSTYVDALPRLSDDKGRIHTHFNQAVASTGRLSSTNPNLQNIPIRTERGQKIRYCFVAPEDRVLLAADYSQVELRILAHVTGDGSLKAAFSRNADIHAATAAEVFGVTESDVTDNQRRTAKAINFGIVYGMSDFGLAENLGIERKQAREFIDRYFLKYPGVKNYMHEVVERGRERGFVETMFGRRRFYPGLRSTNQNLRKMAERAAINMPIQGAAADIIKRAMVAWRRTQKNAPRSARLLLQVHDELIFEVSRDEAPALQEFVVQLMERTTPLSIPLKVSAAFGPSWGDI